MMRFGGAKAALHFRHPHTHPDGTHFTAEQVAEFDRANAEKELGAKPEQQIVAELYYRYERQQQRARDYRNLFGFLSFFGLFLGVLYCQRSAEIAYQVNSTILAVVNPGQGNMQSTNDVYTYLSGLLTSVWTDPVCGDGVCEIPFEYASYSTFGCQADCGLLAQKQNLTSIMVDLYYDFTHPVGSMPASELMNQAAWNLCPIATPYSTSCYYAADNTFTRLSGETHMVITDSPDGQWDLLIKLDIFDKIRGAVRSLHKVMNSAYYYKVAIAAIAAKAEQSFEISLLTNGSALATTPYWTYVTNTLSAQYPPANVTYLVSQLQIASCACVSGAVLSNTSDSTTAFTNAQFFVAFNNSIDARTGAVFDTTMAASYYTANYCPGSPVLQSVLYYNVTAANNVTTLYNVSQVILASNATALSIQCTLQLAQMLSYRANLTTAVQQDLMDLRLGDGKTTGKFATRVSIQASLQSYLTAHFPELIDPVFNTPSGSSLSDPVSATLPILVEGYVQGPYFQTNVQSAYYGLVRSVVYNPAALLPNLAIRANARIAEVKFQQGDTAANMSVPLPEKWALEAGSNIAWSVGQVLTEFVAAGLTTVVMPDPSTPLLHDFQINYNLANWSGNATAYMLANLPLRAPSYIGNCTNMAVSCNVSASAGLPYNCNNLMVATNDTIQGNLSDISYRLACEAPCDKKLDCNTVCECYGTCGLQQVCTCGACTDTSSVFYLPAASDSSFLSIAASAASAGQASANIAGLGLTASASAGRRLLQQSTSDQLAAVLTQVGGVKTQQDSIVTQMTTLQAQVDRANQLATQRANDQTLINLIQTGNQEIQAGQAAVQAQLDTIIGQENQALSLATAAAAALSSIQDLATKQLAAQSALNSAVQAQLQSIKIATATGTISIAQALAVWKRARRDQALTNKAAVLANIPCNPLNYEDNFFNLTTDGNYIDTTSARERNIGLNNRVVGGMLLTQTRSSDINCSDSKFRAIQQTCTGGPSTSPYGVDPVFKSGTTSYNPSFADPAGVIVTQYYDCTQLPNPTYNITFLNGTTNLAPFCAELFNPEKAPFAFHSFPMQNKKNVFPIWFDINLGGGASQAWNTYMQEGLYLDTHTTQLDVQLVTYNAAYRMFGYFDATFAFSEGGSININYQLYTVRLELYLTDGDWVRLVFEIILNVCIILLCLHSVFMFYLTTRKGHEGGLFGKGWSWLDSISNALLLTAAVMWWVFVCKFAHPFEITLRYDVYPPPLQPAANFLALNNNGTHLAAGDGATTVSSFDNLSQAINFLNWYYFINGINILLVIARVLKLMDFQPRLGVVTRSLWLAGPDLIHFALVAGMVFVGYAMMAHLIFGNAIPEFQSFGSSINTCFEILLGNINVNDELRALGGLQSVAGALFFWSYELLVYMVLLNFLLAIIVDAFSEVKSKTSETIGLHTELYHLFRDKTRDIIGHFSQHHISSAKLGAMLKQWAGEEDLHKEKGDEVVLPKLVMVMNEPLDEATLCAVLEECRKDAPLPTADGSEDGGKGGPAQPPGRVAAALLACIGRGGEEKSVIASPEEIALAAHYIVDRFGTVPTKEKAKGDELRLKMMVHDMGGEEEAAKEETGKAEYNGHAREMALEAERDQLANALERLAEVQRELADGQRSLMSGQKQLADQQGKLVALMNIEAQL